MVVYKICFINIEYRNKGHGFRLFQDFIKIRIILH
jgi:hypothetical protein